MRKVCLLTRTTVVNDAQTLSEAEALGRAGLRVVVIGRLGRNLPEHEHYENFEIRRTLPAGLTAGSRSRLRGKANSRSAHASLGKKLRGMVRKLPEPLRFAATGWCLLQAAWKENAAYYHAHSPISLMLGLLAVAKLRRSRFVADYNEILVLEKPDKVTDRYELDDLWGGELSDAEGSRIEATVSLIPDEVKSVLDVGCGDGRLTNLLQGAFDRVVGLDISETALRYVNGETVTASAADIPFPDRSFDTVISTETIEHLPHGVYNKAINEIKRVAKDWIVIGVPWREQLSIGFIRCARCKVKFHVNYHFRNFNYGIMADLLRPEWRMVQLEKIGTNRQYYASPLLWIRQHVAGIWTRTPSTICPRCNTRLFPGNSREANTLSFLCNIANNKIKEYIRTDKSHCIAVYEPIKR